jgi:hypothetical protein
VWKVVIARINSETVGRMMHHRTAVFQHLTFHSFKVQLRSHVSFKMVACHKYCVLYGMGCCFCANNRIISGILYNEGTPDLEIICDLLSASKLLSIHFLDAALKVSC